MSYSKEDIELLKNHVSNLDKQIYIIYNVPPEVISALFAYVSRSPASFRDNLLKLIKTGEIKIETQTKQYFAGAQEQAAKFHEKWVVGFGHFSVAEHAVLNIAIEDVSILLSKIIEDNRLASYTEKSTRYQIFDRNRYYKPKKIMQSKYASDYVEVMNKLFDFYTENFPQAIEFMREKYPKSKEMSERFHEAMIKSKACDVMRYVLPASTLTNIGATFNARSLVHAIRKLLSSPLEEAQHIGMLMKEEASKFIPTIIKAAEKSDYIEKANLEIAKLSSELFEETEERSEENNVKLIDYDRDAEDKLLAAILYKHLHESFEKVLEKVRNLSKDEKERIFSKFFEGLANKDAPLRELEHSYYTFEITVDFGAYRDLQRHRMCTQTTQLLSTKHGFSMPEEMQEIGLAKEFKELMKESASLYGSIASEMPYEAQYCLPLAYRKRTLFSMNARELFHIIRLRSSKAGHKSYRRIAQQMYLELKKVHPLLAKFFKVNLE